MQVALNRHAHTPAPLVRRRGVPLSPQQLPGEGAAPSPWVFVVFHALFIPRPQVSLSSSSSSSSPASPFLPGSGGEDAEPWLGRVWRGGGKECRLFGRGGRAGCGPGGRDSEGGVPVPAAPPQ